MTPLHLQIEALNRDLNQFRATSLNQNLSLADHPIGENEPVLDHVKLEVTNVNQSKY